MASEFMEWKPLNLSFDYMGLLHFSFSVGVVLPTRFIYKDV